MTDGASCTALVPSAFGRIRGRCSEGGIAILGLRYATAERWGPPRMVQPWDGVYDATTFRPSCPQVAGVETSAEQSEDCLYLNVWLPVEPNKVNRTLVFIHGGSFEVGSISPMYNNTFLYEGSKLASTRGVAVATMQYRLGALG